MVTPKRPVPYGDYMFNQDALFIEINVEIILTLVSPISSNKVDKVLTFHPFTFIIFFPPIPV